ncbi:MAG: NAD(P)/FAD-dependent oxidoreductase [Spirochaetaceae bacterium]|nr:NAD(P)/FAD-dependent oxidoreductase [Spirochaetaceae bacterium]MCF7948065.1 NAD(P)/FAD-dependent oxidoreductase [Spirochaetia bacterium]MCF7950426.1 NAD(P)/FAD-dependent oxidoreductase [Spirochaetaceae bacterium]
MSKKKIVVLGGGYGGITATKKLYKKYKKNPNVEITLIDRNPYHTLMTELHEVAGSRVEPDSVQVSFQRIFGGTSVKLITDTIKDIDFDNNTLKSDLRSYSYDYLVIGAGGEPEFFDIPGVQENSFTIWSFDDAMRLRNQIEDRFMEAAREPDETKRRRMLTFVVAGAGFTGVELAGEILERKQTLCREYHLKEHEVRVIIVEALDTILPILPAKMQNKAERYLRKKGAEIMTEAPVVGAEEGFVKLSDDRSIDTDTFIWTCGIHGSEFTARIPLTKGQTAKGECSYASSEGIHGMSGCRLEEEERYIVGERGRILVDEEMKSVDHANVYLVGDIIWYLDNEKVVPQIVETALQTGEVAGENIIADIEEKERKKFKPNYHGFMVSIGGRYGVAHVVGMSMSGMLAMAMKHMINLHYLFGIAGVNAVWRYLQHEFFTIKEHRSFIGGHLAAKVPIYWTVPLRLFLGGKWLYEGIKHIGDGWLNPGDGGLADVWTGAVKLPGVVFEDAAAAATAAADATSAATGAAAEGAAEGAAEYGEPLMEALGIYTWFAENVLSASPLLAFLLQSAVVLGQVAIGLALIGGLLTFPAAIVSIGFSIMFIFSGWGNPELLWYIMVSIVMLGGAGRGFGLDHWVMPWLKHQWNSTKLAQKTHLYDGEPVIKE